MINHQLMWYLIINNPIIISFKLVMSSDKWQCQSPLSQKPEIGSGQASLLHNGVHSLVYSLSISGIGLPLHIDSFCVCGPVTSHKVALILKIVESIMNQTKEDFDMHLLMQWKIHPSHCLNQLIEHHWGTNTLGDEIALLKVLMINYALMECAKVSLGIMWCFTSPQ